MGSESIAHDSKGQMGFWLRGHNGARNNKSNQLVKNIKTKQLKQAKGDSAAIVLVFKAGAFHYQWAITYSLVVAQPIRTQH